MVNVNGMKTKQLPHNFAISIDVILISMHRINNEILYMNNCFLSKLTLQRTSWDFVFVKITSRVRRVKSFFVVFPRVV